MNGPKPSCRSPERLSPADPRLPAELFELERPPADMWVLGSLAALDGPRVAIVGTREATPYGERVTRELAGALARAGACIVSGLARGIDAAAHNAALAAHGRTVAVLGTGVDIAYPVGHRHLHSRIAQEGLLISEHPPGTRAYKGSFPRRNRIIAALAHVVIVVEAPVRSGALNTAAHALELQRTVAAVPGPIDAPTSAGANALLRDGAHVIGSIGDAIALAGLSAPSARRRIEPEGDERDVWLALANGGLELESLVAATRLPAGRCLAAVTALELAGAVECEITGEIRRR